MKVFQVITENANDKEIIETILYVAGESLLQVTTFYTTECEQFEEDLKSVREVLTVTRNLIGKDFQTAD